MTTVTILGHDLKVAFNMAVEIEYEEMSGQPFDLESMNTQKATMQLCYAALKVANKTMPFTFDQLNHDISFSETADLKNSVISAMNDWLGIPAVMDKEEPESQQQQDGEEPKND